MSTKIYNGYRFDKKMSLIELSEFTQNLRKKIKQIAELEYMKVYINLLISAIDKHQFGIYCEIFNNHGLKEDYLFFSVSDYMSHRMRQIELTGLRDPTVDFDFNINIHPLKNKTLIILYTESSILRKAFERMPLIKDYCYYDNTDKPKNVSEKEWEKRGKDWDVAFGGKDYLTPMETGLNFKPYESIKFNNYQLSDFNGEKPLSYQKKVIKLIPSLEDRAYHIAESLHCMKFMKLNKKENGNTIDLYYAHKKFLRSEEGNIEISKLIDEIKPKLTLRNVKSLKELRFQFKIKHPEVLRIYKSTNEK